MDNNEREIFLQVLDITDAADRDQFLQRACGSDLSLRQRVEQLLHAHQQAAQFLEKSPFGMAPTIQTDDPLRWHDSLKNVPLDFLRPSDKPGCLGLLGKYEIVGLVGRGGCGLVFRAYDPRLSRIVAIKVMAPELASNPMAVQRFLREAQAAAAVRHEHVITIYAIEEASTPPFIVMEFVEGQSLKDKVDRHGALELEEILRIGLQTARGLEAAHAQGLVHRDIKPANILLENGIQRVKITDFGLARAVDDVGVTQTGMIAGTPEYMSPEQGLGRPIDGRSDLFSLGAVLYTLCTGRSPFRADSAVATLRRVCDDAPRAIREVNPQVPPWLEELVMRLLDKQADRRFQSAGEVCQILRDALVHVQSQSSVQAMPAAIRAAMATIHGPKLELARLWYVALVSVQMLALMVSLLVAGLEVASILLTGPLFGGVLGGAISFVAYRARFKWPAIALGIVSIVFGALIFLTIVFAGLSPGDRVPILAMCSMYVGVMLIMGGWQLRRNFADAVTPWNARVRLLYLNGLVLYLLAIAAAVVNAAVEFESIPATSALLGLVLGPIVVVLSFQASEDRCSRGFALATWAAAVGMLVFCLTSFAGFRYAVGGQVTVVRLVLAFGVMAMPLGMFALARELDLLERRQVSRPKFGLVNVLAAVAVFALVFAVARPCFAFSVEAFLAGTLFALSVLVVAGMVAYRFYRQKGALVLRHCLSVGTATLAILATFMVLVVWYDRETDYGYIVVRSPEPVKLEIYNRSLSSTVLREIQRDGQPLGTTPLGEIEVRVVGRDDLRVVPERMTVIRGTPMELKVEPIAENGAE